MTWQPFGWVRRLWDDPAGREKPVGGWPQVPEPNTVWPGSAAPDEPVDCGDEPPTEPEYRDYCTAFRDVQRQSTQVRADRDAADLFETVDKSFEGGPTTGQYGPDGHRCPSPLAMPMALDEARLAEEHRRVKYTTKKQAAYAQHLRDSGDYDGVDLDRIVKHCEVPIPLDWRERFVGHKRRSGNDLKPYITGAQLEGATEAMEALRDDLALDNCERCLGFRGGVRGNENRVNGLTLCDFCSVDASNATSLRTALAQVDALKERCARWYSETEETDDMALKAELTRDNEELRKVLAGIREILEPHQGEGETLRSTLYRILEGGAYKDSPGWHIVEEAKKLLADYTQDGEGLLMTLVRVLEGYGGKDCAAVREDLREVDDRLIGIRDQLQRFALKENDTLEVILDRVLEEREVTEVKLGTLRKLVTMLRPHVGETGDMESVTCTLERVIRKHVEHSTCGNLKGRDDIDPDEAQAVFNELVALLQQHVGETGASESAVETLERVLSDHMNGPRRCAEVDRRRGAYETDRRGSPVEDWPKGHVLSDTPEGNANFRALVRQTVEDSKEILDALAELAAEPMPEIGDEIHRQFGDLAAVEERATAAQTEELSTAEIAAKATVGLGLGAVRTLLFNLAPGPFREKVKYYNHMRLYGGSA